MNKSFAIVLFRNDLRIHDHEPLTSALETYQGRIIPLYCFDPRQYGKTYHFGFPKTGPYRAKFNVESIECLRKNIKSRFDGDLLVRVGKPEQVIGDLIHELDSQHKISIDAVFAHKEVADEEIRVEEGIQKIFDKSNKKDKSKLNLFWGGVTLHHIDDLPFDIHAKNRALSVFTQFRKEVESSDTPIRTPIAISKQKIQSTGVALPLGDIPTVESLMSIHESSNLFFKEFLMEDPNFVQADGTSAPDSRPKEEQIAEEKDREKSKFTRERQTDSSKLLKGGEDAALARVQDYFFGRGLLSTYKDTRNGLLGTDYSSHLSPWLSNGCISPRYVYHEIKRYEKEVEANNSTYWLFFELLWRDYFRWINVKHGNSIFFLHGLRDPKKYNEEWSNDMSVFKSWAKGQTGYPFVDANMIEMNSTGFMSNRGRQNVASFLTKDLHIDWRMGAEYFESFLLDHDVAANYGNWLYVAGVGNDPRESRYFHVVKQGQMYDPKGLYVSYWLPQLKRLSNADAKLNPSAYMQSAKSAKDFDLDRDYCRPIVQIKAHIERGNQKPQPKNSHFKSKDYRRKSQNKEGFY